MLSPDSAKSANKSKVSPNTASDIPLPLHSSNQSSEGAITGCADFNAEREPVKFCNDRPTHHGAQFAVALFPEVVVVPV